MNSMLMAEDGLRIQVNASDFFGLNAVSRVKDRLEIALSDHAYRPKETDLRSDWVASVATPAFKLLSSEGVRAERFCTIGTGAGLDALAAIEILQSSSIFVTDLHDDVASRAAQNIISNVENAAVSIRYAVGDLLVPIVADHFTADLLYENLPNIPLTDETDLADGQASSTFITDRTEALPDFVSRYLLALHHIVLKNARAVLQPGGRVLSSIGGRVPLRIILQLAAEAGHAGRILLYTWKQQSEPEEVIGGYAHWETAGLGPFTFYPLPALEAAFQYGVASGADAAMEIETSLQPHALSAKQALQAFHSGTPIGHTVAVLESTLVAPGREAARRQYDKHQSAGIGVSA